MPAVNSNVAGKGGIFLQGSRDRSPRSEDPPLLSQSFKKIQERETNEATADSGWPEVAVCTVPVGAERSRIRPNRGVRGLFALECDRHNMRGVGGRVGVGIAPYVKLEAEMAYDFTQEYTTGFTSTGGGIITFQNSGVRTLHGLFGPKDFAVPGSKGRIHQLFV